MANRRTEGFVKSNNVAHAGLRVKLFEQDTIGPLPLPPRELGHATTDANGFYAIEYNPNDYGGPLDLDDRIETSPGEFDPWTWTFSLPTYEAGNPELFIKVFDAVNKDMSTSETRNNVSEDTLRLDHDIGGRRLNKETQGRITTGGFPAEGLTVKVYHEHRLLIFPWIEQVGSETTTDSRGMFSVTYDPLDKPNLLIHVFFWGVPIGFSSVVNAFEGRLCTIDLDLPLRTPRPLPSSFEIQNPEFAASYNLSPPHFQTRFDQLKSLGYQLAWLQGYGAGPSGPQFSAIWRRLHAEVQSEVRHHLTSTQFQQRFDELAADGFRLICFSGYPNGNQTNYAAVWTKSATNTPWQARYGLSASEFQTRFDQNLANGFRLVFINGYNHQNSDRYAGIWVKDNSSTEWVARHGLGGSAFDQLNEDLKFRRFQPRTVSAHKSNAVKLAAIWQKATGSAPATSTWQLERDIDFNQLHWHNLNRTSRDFLPTGINSYEAPGGNRFVALWTKPARLFGSSGRTLLRNADAHRFHNAMRQFMTARDISCGALAITVGGRLVHAFGYRNGVASFPTTETSLFRIASVSKPITATAVLRLIQDGQLQLDTKVMSVLNMTPPPALPGKPRLEDATVQHLLQHTGGWKTLKEQDLQSIQLAGIEPDVVMQKAEFLFILNMLDPMFADKFIAALLLKSLPITRTDIITYMTRRGLWHHPGTTFDYSNYGYCLLGRIVEAISGKNYEELVKEKVLSPLGITNMRIGRTHFEDRASNEVPYFTRGTGLVESVASSQFPPPLVMQAYGSFNLENMDSHGGWLASAVDLARFASTFDNPNTSPVLNANSVNEMRRRPTFQNGLPQTWYGCGWQFMAVLGGIEWSHNGSLAGTWTNLKRRPDGVNFTYLFNKRDPEDDVPSDIDGQMEFMNQRTIAPGNWFAIDPLVENQLRAMSSGNLWPSGDLFSNYFS